MIQFRLKAETIHEVPATTNIRDVMLTRAILAHEHGVDLHHVGIYH